ncbi:hypothetical protein GOBAR_DD00716 [Gossypium barbadense]|nr:hypothetical protein GOBAR_DD00716 [Gossypium barbadense]
MALSLQKPPKNEFYVKDGHLFPALTKAIVTVKREEKKVKLIVEPNSKQMLLEIKGKDANDGFPSIPPKVG